MSDCDEGYDDAIRDFRNGIDHTPDDVSPEYAEGYEAGIRDCEENERP